MPVRHRPTHCMYESDASPWAQHGAFLRQVDWDWKLVRIQSPMHSLFHGVLPQPQSDSAVEWHWIPVRMTPQSPMQRLLHGAVSQLESSCPPFLGFPPRKRSNGGKRCVLVYPCRSKGCVCWCFFTEGGKKYLSFMLAKTTCFALWWDRTEYLYARGKGITRVYGRITHFCVCMSCVRFVYHT